MKRHYKFAKLVFGSKWVIPESIRMYAFGFLTSLSIISLYLTYLVYSAAINQEYMHPFLNSLKTDSIYLCWAYIILTTLLVYAYVDGEFFSGSATAAYQIALRVIFSIIPLIGISMWYWYFWFATEPGTVSVSYIQNFYWFQMATGIILPIVSFSGFWYLSRGLVTGTNNNARKMILIMGSSFTAYLLLIFYLSNNSPMIKFDITSITTTVGAIATFSVAMHEKRDVEVLRIQSQEGIIFRFVRYSNTYKFLIGFAISGTISWWLIRSSFPISSGDLLLTLLYYMFLPTIVVLYMNGRLLRTTH